MTTTKADVMDDTRVHLAAVAALVVDLYSGQAASHMVAKDRQKLLSGLRDFVLKVADDVKAGENAS